MKTKMRIVTLLTFLCVCLLVISVQAETPTDMQTLLTEKLAAELTQYVVLGDEDQPISEVDFVFLKEIELEKGTASGVCRFTAKPYMNTYVADFSVTFTSSGEGLSIQGIVLTNLGPFITYDSVGTDYGFEKRPDE